jgi:hypothetical protein
MRDENALQGPRPLPESAQLRVGEAWLTKLTSWSMSRDLDPTGEREVIDPSFRWRLISLLTTTVINHP